MPSFFLKKRAHWKKTETMDDLKATLVELKTLQTQRKYAAALELAQQAMRQFPRARPLAIEMAGLQEIFKNYPQALALYNALHEESKKDGKTEFRVLLGMARCLFKLSKYQQAEELFEKLLSSAPNQPDVLTGLASCRRHKGKIADAEALAARALKANPMHHLALHEMAEICLANKETEKALELLEQNIRRADLHGDSIDLWLSTLNTLERNRYAQNTLEELAKQHPDVVEFVYGFAVLANRAGEISLARPAYAKALSLSPANPRIYYEMGLLERVAGDLVKSQQFIEKALELRPDNPAALRTFGSDLKYAYGDDNYKRLNYVAAKFTDFPPIEQIHLHYAIAKAHEDVGEMDAAFRHYQIAGEKKRKLEPYNERQAAKLIQIIPKVITRERLTETKQKGCDSEIPVFILGMPRSGTSLMEQILSAHPDIFGAGELKFLPGVLENVQVGQNRLRLGDREPVFDYEQNATWEMRGQRYVDRIRKLADRPYQRIVDKMPGNFNFVGMIHAILPNARIIHSRRHPVETCLSCYRIHFAEGHQWSYNLRELGRFYKRYWALMKFWREEFPGVMLEVRYEDNVADVEGSAKNLIDYLGLEWNQNCLNFYNVDRPVKTASVTQVRKPIYTTSTNRWRKYEKYLGPLLEELGDIVPEYEAEITHLIEK